MRSNCSFDAWTHGLVDLFRATHLSEGHIHEKVGQWWDLPSLETLYADFLERHGPALQRWLQHEGEGSESPELLKQAFTAYVPMVTQWRRHTWTLELPEEYLPL